MMKGERAKNSVEDPFCGISCKIAQILFFASGACAALLFGGVEIWVQGLVSILLAGACILAAWSRGPAGQLSFRVTGWIAALLIWVFVSLIPWPAGWAGWISPVQAELLGGLESWRPKWLHVSMASPETWRALGRLAGGGAVLYLSWFWSASQTFRSSLHGFIFSMGFVVALLGLADHLDGSDRLYGWRETSQAIHWGPFMNRNHFSNYLNIGILAGLGFFVRHAFPRRRRRASRWLGWRSLVIVLFCGCMSLSTASKGGLISLVMGLLVFSGLLLRQKALVRSRIMVIFLLLAVGLVFTYGRSVVQRTEAWVKAPIDPLNEGRWQVWKDSWAMGWETRGRGIGVGAFEKVFPSFQTTQGAKTITHPENEYIQVWAEWGIPGSLIWIALGCLVLGQARRALAGRPSAWQIAGWSALIVMAVHAAVDFPFHIPSNAWLALALLGSLLRDPSGEKIASAGGELLPVYGRARPLPLAMAVVLLGAGWMALFAPRENFQEIMLSLKTGEFKRAWNCSQKELERTPFYWRSHELAGYSAAGLPSMIREAQHCFDRAQRLSPSNPLISWYAGDLFLTAHPAMARDFYETALSIEEEPKRLLSDRFRLSVKDPEKLKNLLPMALQDPQRWNVAWQWILSMHDRDLAAGWLREAADRWLEDPVQRGAVIGALLEGGMSKEALLAFEKNPPRSDEERYGQARAFEAAGNHERAALQYRSIWESRGGVAPSFSTIDLNDRAIRKAALSPENIEFQRQVAGAFYQLEQYHEAQAGWERILRQIPNDLQARYGMAAGFQKMGNWPKAAGFWRSLAEDSLK